MSADRPRVLDALRVDGVRRHAVIEASAGTGKTHTLEHLVVELLLEGASIEEVLVVTFTEKAALEMRARIRARIAALVKSGQAALAPALAGFDRAPISTIHAFCQRVLIEHAFASGRLLEEERVDAREAFGRAFREALRRGIAAEAPLREIWLAALEDGAAAELEERLWRWSRERAIVRPLPDREELSRALASFPTPTEIEGVAGRSLLAAAPVGAPRLRLRKLLAELAPLAQRARTGDASTSLFAGALRWGRTPLDDADKTAARVLESALATHPTGPAARTIAAAVWSPLPAMIAWVLPSIRAELEREKQASGRFDFDDLLLSVEKALSSPQGGVLAASLRARHRYALLDEFQDTDPTQWAIFRRIFFEAGSEGRSALYLIGDPKQSIYGFRNADVHTYLAACEQVVQAGGARAHLVDCFRSTAPMIAAINRVLEAGFFTGPNEYPYPVRCGRPELRATTAEGAEVAPVTLFHLVGKDTLRAKPLRSALADAIAEEIEKLALGGLLVTDRRDPQAPLRPVEHSDVFVLTRTAKEGREVADALRRRAIPYAFFKQDGLFATHEAKDVLDVLRALEDPDDRGPRLRAWLTPFFGATLDQLEACLELPADHPFVDRIYRWSALAEQHEFAALFAAMLAGSGLSRRLLYLRESERELVNYQHVLELLLALASRGRMGLRELVQELGELTEGRAGVATDEGVQRLESERASVQLLTMHKSKGLEAEVVFLFGGFTQRPTPSTEPRIVHDGHERVAWLGEAPPAIQQRIDEEEAEEQQRLLYVAMTRARSRLYLPYFGAPPSGESLPEGMDSYFEKLNGPYRVMSARLCQLAERGGLDSLFERRVVTVRGSRRRIALPPPLPAIDADATGWASPPSHEERFERLRGVARGVETTSYTRMKSARSRSERMIVEADEPQVFVEELAREPFTPDPVPENNPLPGGTGFGIFVHSILERIDFALVARTDEPVTLLEDGRTRAIFDAAGAANAIASEFFPPTAELVHRTLRSPLRAPGWALPEGLASRRKRLAEMSFLHPIPERAHPAFGVHHGPDRPALAVERGFVRGVIDLLFEQDGKTYLLDWKTDRLPVYDAAALAAHVETHYEIQARLYSLAMARFLGVRDDASYEERFGGIVYAFVRGLHTRSRGPTEGITFSRPSLALLGEWDRELRESDAPWGHPLPPRPSSPLEEEP